MNKSFSLSDQMYFAQRLSLLLKSGVAMSEALSMMQNIESSSVKKQIYIRIISSIQQGVTLSKSIRNAGAKFNELLITLIKNGESSGHLSEALQQAHAYLEKRDDMKKKLISSLLYPVFIVLATIAMTLFLILYIFPKIIPLLGSLDIELPLITRIVQGIYHLSIGYGLLIILGLISFALISRLIVMKSEQVRYKSHLFVISFPFLGPYIRTYLMSSFCSMGEMMLSSGKGLPDLLVFSAESARNAVYKKLFAEMHMESIQGISLSMSMKKQGKAFPPLLADMSALGEKTGDLGLMLGHCSRIFEQDIDNALKRFSSLIEPSLMVLMGLVVGSIALSIILQVYEITNHLSK